MRTPTKNYINKEFENLIDPNIADYDEEHDKENNEISKITVPGYEFDSCYKGENNTILYDLAYNPYKTVGSYQVFATVRGNRCLIYGCKDDTGVELLRRHITEDPTEAYATCVWTSHSKTNQPLVIFAGRYGLILIWNVVTKEMSLLSGHMKNVNQLKLHPLHKNVLLSCSRDCSIRLWNINTTALIAIFAGTHGHRSDVLTIAFSANGDRFVSGGMDRSLKIWDIKHDEIEKCIKLSNTFSQYRARKFPTYRKHYPYCTINDIHKNSVICVQWFGNLIISKSCEDLIIIWRINEKQKPEIVTKFEFENCRLWYARFDFNDWKNVIACGNGLGEIHVWELNESSLKDSCSYILKHKKCNTAIRQVSFSKDAKFLLAVSDDGTIWRWNKI